MSEIKHTIQDRKVFGCAAKEGRTNFSLERLLVGPVDRAALTDSIFNQIIASPNQYDLTYNDFWINRFNKSSLRLTKRGFVLLSKTLSLEYYSTVFRDDKNSPMDLLNSIVLLRLDRTMTCPYYIEEGYRLNLFGEKEQMWLALAGNDIVKFLDSWS